MGVKIAIVHLNTHILWLIYINDDVMGVKTIFPSNMHIMITIIHKFWCRGVSKLLFPSKINTWCIDIDAVGYPN